MDDEPEPFWEGDDEAARIERWREAVGFDADTMGTVATCRRFNGPSGVKLRERYLAPLGLGRSDCWISDAVDTYRLSTGQRARIDDTYGPVAQALGLPEATVRPHPSEDEIVAEAVAHHLDRLRTELEIAAAAVIITLGNAAQRVLRDLLRPSPDQDPGPAVGRGSDYGHAVKLHLANRVVTWLPLAHPVAPPSYQEWHDAWLSSRLGA